MATRKSDSVHFVITGRGKQQEVVHVTLVKSVADHGARECRELGGKASIQSIPLADIIAPRRDRRAPKAVKQLQGPGLYRVATTTGKVLIEGRTRREADAYLRGYRMVGGGA